MCPEASVTADPGADPDATGLGCAAKLDAHELSVRAVFAGPDAALHQSLQSFFDL